jgi:prepilin-type N-terminal cleavage/methylation domain-containing protein
MRRGFTLIELLVVIAILAILAVVVVLTLNPAELLRQGRDANRVSDMSTLNEAVNLYDTDQGGASGYLLGSPNSVYVSIPDPNATTTAGTNCSSLGLPTLPSTYTYHCAGPNYYRKVNGTGWIPVNFSNISAGSPLSSLPVDPINSSSSRLYYTYTTNGTQFEVTAAMESAKYGVGGSNDQISGDGGPLATVYEKGSQLGLEPLDYGDPTLVGWWPLNEGAGTVAYDDSGNNATGSWSGTQTGTSGYYSPGKVGSYAGYFNGTNDYVDLGYINYSSFPAVSLAMWINVPSTMVADMHNAICNGGTLANASGFCLTYYQGDGSLWIGYGGGEYTEDGFTFGQWQQVVYVIVPGVSRVIYVNGVPGGTLPSLSQYPLDTGQHTFLGSSGGAGQFLNATIDDVRVYNRALSAAQIAAMYAGGK